MPEVAEEILTRGDADLDLDGPAVARRPRLGAQGRQDDRGDEINTCIACNQACLDHVFVHKDGLVPAQSACRPRDANWCSRRPGVAKRVAVVGAGPAGLSAAVDLAERGHRVELFEADAEIGGQFGSRAPDPRQGGVRRDDPVLHTAGSNSPASTCISATAAAAARAGRLRRGRRWLPASRPRVPRIPGIDHPMVLSYAELVRDGTPVGRRVAVIGAGGIGFDVSEFLTVDGARRRLELDDVDARSGASPTRRPRPARSPNRDRAVPRGRWSCCSASPARSVRRSARPPAGCTGRR